MWVVIERCGVARFVACLGVVDRGWAYDASALSILVGSRCSRMTSVAAVAKAAGGSLNQCVKLTLFLTDLGQFPVVNAIMPEYIATPYPARSTVGVSSLPRGAQFEVEAVMVLD